MVREGGPKAQQSEVRSSEVLQHKRHQRKRGLPTSFTFRLSKGMSAVMPLRSANLSAYAGTSEM